MPVLHRGRICVRRRHETKLCTRMVEVSPMTKSPVPPALSCVKSNSPLTPVSCLSANPAVHATPQFVCRRGWQYGVDRQGQLSLRPPTADVVCVEPGAPDGPTRCSLSPTDLVQQASRVIVTWRQCSADTSFTDGGSRSYHYSKGVASMITITRALLDSAIDQVVAVCGGEAVTRNYSYSGRGMYGRT